MFGKAVFLACDLEIFPKGSFLPLLALSWYLDLSNKRMDRLKEAMFVSDCKRASSNTQSRNSTEASKYLVTRNIGTI